MSQDYHQTRFTPDPRREVLWQTLCRQVFERWLTPDACVLDLGAGYGHFINNVRARRRIAVDHWAGMLRYIHPGVEGLVGDVGDLDRIEDGVVDFALASNIFEHLVQDRLAQVLRELARTLAPSGRLAVLQPNYAYAYREYFDDFTHVSVWSHVSLPDFLEANGFDVLETHPRFLPLTLKSRLPVSRLLIKAYLRSPLKPMGKQMLVVARRRGGSGASGAEEAPVQSS